MGIAARRSRSLDGIGDRRHLHVLRRFVSTVHLHQLDGIARSDLHHVPPLGIGQRGNEFARESREGHHTHFAAVGCRSFVYRILRGELCEIGTTLDYRQQAVGQRLLRIGQHDMADSQRIGHHFRIQHTGHRPLVVLQHGAVSLTRQQCLGLVLRKLSRRNIGIGDLAVAVGTYERLQLLRSGELCAHLGNALFESEHIVVRGGNLEHDIRQRTRGSLLEHILMAVVVCLDVAGLHLDQRIGDSRIFLTGPFPGIGIVGRIHTVRDFECIDIYTALDQAEVLGDLTLHAGLLVELRPRLLCLRIRFGLREELSDGSHVVLTRAGIGEGVVERLRRMLAADHRQTLGLRNAQPHLVETGFQHILADQGLPCSIGEHGGLLFVALLGAALRLDLLVLVVVLRIVDFFTVDDTDPGVVTREAHFGLQGENESQEGACDDNRQHDAELGAKSV